MTRWHHKGRAEMLRKPALIADVLYEFVQEHRVGHSFEAKASPFASRSRVELGPQRLRVAVHVKEDLRQRENILPHSLAPSGKPFLFVSPLNVCSGSIT
jgi:hypothetical protein